MAHYRSVGISSSTQHGAGVCAHCHEAGRERRTEQNTNKRVSTRNISSSKTNYVDARRRPSYPGALIDGGVLGGHIFLLISSGLLGKLVWVVKEEGSPELNLTEKLN